jgi:hypothetical protein
MSLLPCFKFSPYFSSPPPAVMSRLPDPYSHTHVGEVGSGSEEGLNNGGWWCQFVETITDFEFA